MRNISLEITVHPNPWCPPAPVTLGREVSLRELPRVGEHIVFNSGFGAVVDLEPTGNPYLTLKTQRFLESEFEETLQQLLDDGWIII